MAEAATQDEYHALVFEAGGQRYALAADDVLEIVRAVAISPLPKAPAIVEGIVNVRGKVAAVLDIRTRFRLRAKPLHHTDHFILAWAGPRLVALRADRALDLITLDPSQVEDAKLVVPDVEYIVGVARLPDGLVLIHDLRTFLSAAEAAALDGAISMHPQET